MQAKPSKSMLLLTIIFCIAILTGCNSTSNNTGNNTTTPPASTPESTDKTAPITSIAASTSNTPSTPVETVETTSILDIISEGRVDTVEFGIGASVKDIIEAYGEPEEKDNFMGGSFISYKDFTFFIDKNIEEIEEGIVVKLGFSEGSELFGVNVGMKFDDIKKILGDPTFEGAIDEEEANDELYGSGSALIYQKGVHRLLFIGDEGSEFANQAYLE